MCSSATQCSVLFLIIHLQRQNESRVKTDMVWMRVWRNGSHARDKEEDRGAYRRLVWGKKMQRTRRDVRGGFTVVILERRRTTALLNDWRKLKICQMTPWQSPAIGWPLIQGVPCLSALDCWDRLQHTPTTQVDKAGTEKWMDRWSLHLGRRFSDFWNHVSPQKITWLSNYQHNDPH